MNVKVQAVAPAEVEVDTLAVPLTEEGFTESGSAGGTKLDGLLHQLLQDGGLRGGLGHARFPPAAGLGKRDAIDADAVRTAAAAVAQETGEFSSSIGWALDSSLPLPVNEQAQALVEGTLLGAYDPARWKGNGEKPKLE